MRLPDAFFCIFCKWFGTRNHSNWLNRTVTRKKQGKYGAGDVILVHTFGT